ncbi:MAG: hypothetical protein KatS3mg009_1003 [Acidimicrobiia bacterium]|nr:MAG: hypothetical protein KatS3mg009_1003 [Acidimicrobiia bacterium]
MDDGPARLVEVLGALSLGCDAADGFAHETTVRTAVLAGALAARTGDDRLVADAVIGALLRHLGCTGFAVEEARRYGAGDDVGLRAGASGIAPNAWVRVVSARGSMRARAMLTNSVAPGQVFVPMHHAHTNRLTFPGFDPHSRQPSYKYAAIALHSEAAHEKDR